MKVLLISFFLYSNLLLADSSVVLKYEGLNTQLSPQELASLESWANDTKKELEFVSQVASSYRDIDQAIAVYESKISLVSQNNTQLNTLQMRKYLNRAMEINQIVKLGTRRKSSKLFRLHNFETMVSAALTSYTSDIDFINGKEGSEVSNLSQMRENLLDLYREAESKKRNVKYNVRQRVFKKIAGYISRDFFDSSFAQLNAFEIKKVSEIINSNNQLDSPTTSVLLTLLENLEATPENTQIVDDSNIEVTAPPVNLISYVVEVNEVDAHFSDTGILGTFKVIPSGQFLMGSLPSESNFYSTTPPQREVKISRSFALMATEITQMQWYSVMGYNPSKFKQYEHCTGSHTTFNKYTNDEQEICPNNPVERVSWNDAIRFIKKLNDKSGVKGCYGYPNDPSGCYRLPTEAEWEYASRGKKQTPYFFGENPIDLDKYAWSSKNSNQHTHPVGLKEQNQYGLYDIYGNVAELVMDKFNEEKFVSGIDPLNQTWSASLYDYTKSRALRGGTFGSTAEGLRSSQTGGNALPYGSNEYIGFRLARNL